MTFGDRLRWQREKHGWSQLYVADKVGITNTVLSNYERNYRDPDTETLRKLAELYEVSIDYLVGSKVNESNSSANVDPEIADLLDKLKDKGAELQATALLRTASKMTKRQLEDILRVFEMIEKDED